MKSKKEEINMIGNLQKQNEEFKNQVNKINSELESAKAKISALNEESDPIHGDIRSESFLEAGKLHISPYSTYSFNKNYMLPQILVFF